MWFCETKSNKCVGQRDMLSKIGRFIRWKWDFVFTDLSTTHIYNCTLNNDQLHGIFFFLSNWETLKFFLWPFTIWKPPYKNDAPDLDEHLAAGSVVHNGAIVRGAVGVHLLRHPVGRAPNASWNNELHWIS